MFRRDLVAVDEAKSVVLSPACLTRESLEVADLMDCEAGWFGVVEFEPGTSAAASVGVEEQPVQRYELARGRQTLSESCASSLQELVSVQMLVRGPIAVQIVPIGLAERRCSENTMFLVSTSQETVAEQLAAVLRTGTERQTLYRAVWHICCLD